MNEFLALIRQIQQEKNISEELVLKNLENSLKAAYKKRFGTDENAVVRFHENYEGVSLYSQKTIVSDEELDDPLFEITLSEALELEKDAEPGDELLCEIDMKSDFGHGAIHNAKQRSKQGLREIQKDTLFSEFRDKIGELVIGYIQFERNGNIYINLGKTEGVMPKRFQSPREIYRPGDRIKVLIEEVRHQTNGLQIILSRSSPELVRKLFEIEVSEIYDGTVDIYKVVREAGYRTKIAVYSYREDIDPVGACVGVKGARIQNLVRELEGEKIDVLHYSNDPSTFIKQAVSPAQIDQIHILSYRLKTALVVVSKDQLSLAIGKQGTNIRLASRLVGWNLDIKTHAQFAEMDLEAERAQYPEETFEQIEYVKDIESIEGMTPHLIEILTRHGINQIEELQKLSLSQIEEILYNEKEEDIAEIQKIIDLNAEALEASEDIVTENGEIIIYQCPECSYEIDDSMTECPACHIGLSFEEESEES